jgi:hypothetical protein
MFALENLSLAVIVLANSSSDEGFPQSYVCEKTKKKTNKMVFVNGI